MLQTDISTLISPGVLTVETTIIVSVLLVIMLYASLKLRSLFGIFGFMLMIVAFMLTIVTSLDLLWFWLITIAEAFIIVLASLAYTRMAARGKSY